MYASVQIRKLRLQINTIRLPRHAVHSRRSITLQPAIRFGEQINVDVVEKRGDFLIPMSNCSLP
jgi:hypothetical protein